MKIFYEDHRFGAAGLKIIAIADTICQEYAAQGFDLTLQHNW